MLVPRGRGAGFEPGLPPQEAPGSLALLYIARTATILAPSEAIGLLDFDIGLFRVQA